MRKLVLLLSIGLTFTAWMVGPASAWRAIAYGKGSNGTWVVGTSWDAPTSGAAVDKALSGCRKHSNGGDITCRIVAEGNRTAQQSQYR